MVSVYQILDRQLGVYFAQGLEQAGLTQAAPILSSEADDEARIARVTMALQNVADWKLRSQIDACRRRAQLDGAVLFPA